MPTKNQTDLTKEQVELIASKLESVAAHLRQTCAWMEKYRVKELTVTNYQSGKDAIKKFNAFASGVAEGVVVTLKDVFPVLDDEFEEEEDQQEQSKPKRRSKK